MHVGELDGLVAGSLMLSQGMKLTPGDLVLLKRVLAAWNARMSLTKARSTVAGLTSNCFWGIE